HRDCRRQILGQPVECVTNAHRNPPEATPASASPCNLLSHPLDRHSPYLALALLRSSLPAATAGKKLQSMSPESGNGINTCVKSKPKAHGANLEDRDAL
ncbi:hypothetical protein, partial [Mesorhizobium sp.]|uniref:hypothetical protein n=1 Tax=Mesorhizobium sp. TaxID=1871066 RepID=UPI0025C0B2D8